MNCIIEDELADDEEAKVFKESKYSSISYLKIPYPLTDELTGHMRQEKKVSQLSLSHHLNQSKNAYTTTVMMIKILLLQSG